MMVFDAALILVLFSWKVITLLRRSFLGDQANTLDYIFENNIFEIVELALLFSFHEDREQGIKNIGYEFD